MDEQSVLASVGSVIGSVDSGGAMATSGTGDLVGCVLAPQAVIKKVNRKTQTIFIRMKNAP
jgi:hypothetical protein